MELEVPTTSHSLDNNIGSSKPMEVGNDDKKNPIFEDILESLKHHHENFGSFASSLEKLKKRKSKKYSFRGPVGNIFKYCR